MTRKKWNRTIINSAKLSCAFLMLAAPWLFDFASERVAAWNAWLSGCVVLATTARALATEGKGGTETALAMGIWMVIAPSVLGFPGHTSAAMTHVLFGLAICALTVAKIFAFSPERPLDRSRRRRAAAQSPQFQSDGGRQSGRRRRREAMTSHIPARFVHRCGSDRGS